MYKRSVVLLLIVFSGLSTLHSVAQNSKPLVVFVEGKEFQSASIADQGPNGIGRLAGIFSDLGAITRIVRLDEALPPETSVIVLVRPHRPLAASALARIWVAVENGADLLIAVDPSGPAGENADNANSGLDRLLTLDYGIGILNGVLIQPLSTVDTINKLASSFSYVVPDLTAHPVIKPLVQHDIPLLIWGARHLRVEPFGIDSKASALAYDEPLYAETDTQVFNRNKPAPMEINIGKDYQGRLFVGAVGENSRTHTRSAILADGEMLENGFGLAVQSGTAQPLYPGNFVLTERLASWLLELSEEKWPALTSGFTWIDIDGRAEDWDQNIACTSDSLEDSSIRSLNVQAICAFRNDSYLYLQVRTVAAPATQSQLNLTFDPSQGSKVGTVLVLNVDVIQSQVGEATTIVGDGKMSIGAVIEARIPLRETGTGAAISELCLSNPQLTTAGETPDCSDGPISIRQVRAQDPAPIRTTSKMLAMTNAATNAVNIRSGPGTNSSVLGSISHGDVFAVIGRNAAGDWIKVQNARLTGWVTSSLVITNGDIQMLPVVPQ